MKKVLLISNMYPSEQFPAYGSFVKQFYELSLEYFDVKCVSMQKQTTLFNKIFHYIVLYVKIIFHILFCRYDLIYVHYISHVSLPVLLCRKLKKFKLVINVHGTDIMGDKKINHILSSIIEKVILIANTIVVPSEYFENVLKDKYQIQEDKIKIYPSGGVSPEVFHVLDNKKNEEFRLMNNLSNYNYYCYASRIDDGKGWDLLCEAIYLIKQSECDFLDYNRFIIIGSGAKDEVLEQLILEYDIKNFIIRKPSLPRNDLNKWYNISKWFIFPTYLPESLGLVGLEALATGTPIIVSDWAGPSTYAKDGLNALQFEVKNSVDLKDKILYSRKIEEQEYRKMCLNSMATASKYFPEAIKNKFITLFE